MGRPREAFHTCEFQRAVDNRNFLAGHAHDFKRHNELRGRAP